MTTQLYVHPSYLDHRTGPHHPERPERLEAIQQVLAHDMFDALIRVEAPRADDSLLTLMHPKGQVDRVLAAEPNQGLVHLDPDTVMSPGSGDAALHATGAVCAAVDAVIEGAADNAFCAVRPPGHHAEAGQAMGFCLFNSVAIGAEHARQAHGIARAAVIDFDVHHGNGTQALFWDREGLFYGSTHQYPHYPGTGAVEDTGAYNNIVNAPLAAHTGSEAFRAAMEKRILPALDAFKPEIILISAGFDAHQQDPLANLNLIEEDFAWATDQLVAMADLHAEGRLVSSLEGGYDLDALATSTATHVIRLMAAA
ncbi:MAG: histone deacetylase family protein [Pseudomonadota bacterium]